MKITKKYSKILNTTIDVCSYESAYADVVCGDVTQGEHWATIYVINSKVEGKGHATTLCEHIKAHYEALGKTVGSSVALNDRMRYILRKTGIKEYNVF